LIVYHNLLKGHVRLTLQHVR